MGLIRLVRQQEFGQCGAACLAMIVSESLAEVAGDVEQFYGIRLAKAGMSSGEIVDFLSRRGFSEPREVLERPDLRPAILTVPSLNHLGLLHYIVWDGERYLDPTCGALRYPDDAPVIGGERIVCWATAIIWKKGRAHE